MRLHEIAGEEKRSSGKNTTWSPRVCACPHVRSSTERPLRSSVETSLSYTALGSTSSTPSRADATLSPNVRNISR